MLSIKIISDTHNLHKKLNINYVDLLIHCGDMTNNGTIKEFNSILNWYKQLKEDGKVKDIISIYGNHDIKMIKYNKLLMNEINKMFKINKNSILLDGNDIIYEDIKIWGHSYVTKKNKLDTDIDIDKNNILKNIPNDIDILLTHIPPKYCLDKGKGCLLLKNKTIELKPKLHCFGHVHSGFGVHKYNGTTYINASGGIIDILYNKKLKRIENIYI